MFLTKLAVAIVMAATASALALDDSMPKLKMATS